jgi:UDP-N-acetylmuramoyl-L-alanyl-D-glutamate--2,6-diaminopimelate ligase
LEIVGSTECRIAELTYDSRRVQQGTLFFALPGSKVDGFDYIGQAVAAGAVAVVAERLPENLSEAVCWVRVANARLAMARMAAQFYGDPTRDLPVIGVTGTNGKTTVTYLLEAIFTQAGYTPAVFGTVAYRYGNIKRPAAHTTPEAIELLRILCEFRAQGADALIMEVSSHALEQYRVDGIHFDLAVFTNLTPEHLDYHQTIDAYFVSKCRLFDQLVPAGGMVINLDDPYGAKLFQFHPGELSFGSGTEAQVRPLQVEVGRDGIHGRFVVGNAELSIDSGMIGDFNVSNLLAAMAAASRFGIAGETIARGLRVAAPVPGRLEKIPNNREILALVDYAHTGDALEQTLKTLAKLDNRRLMAVVGCGGDRDRAKRPVMAATAVHYADLAIFTSDNPRTEDPLAILAEIRAGALQAGGRELSAERAAAGESGFVVVPDRRKAIEFAGDLASAGDLLVVAGKGHEDYQVLGTEKIHFDDREELSRALNQEPAKGEGHV